MKNNAKPIIIIKMGGEAAKEDKQLSYLAGEIKELKIHYSFAIIHGGGKEVSSFSKQAGIEPVFQNGIRMTSREEMDHIDMILAGLINKRLVRLFFTCGLKAVGISGSDGGLFSGSPLKEGTFTGKISRIDPLLLYTLWDMDFLPVIAPSSMDLQGEPLNINADEVSLGIAGEVKAFALIFLSDIPGVLKGERVINKLMIDEIKTEIENGTITGGMIPKVKAAQNALANGVGRIVIGDLKGEGSLQKILSGKKGTSIEK
jgi:acetylglutamate kinase